MQTCQPLSQLAAQKLGFGEQLPSKSDYEPALCRCFAVALMEAFDLYTGCFHGAKACADFLVRCRDMVYIMTTYGTEAGADFAFS